MPTFCRHNRLLQNCPICSREQAIELRPIVSSSAPRSSTATPRQPRAARSTSSPRATRSTSRGGAGVRVRRLARGDDDGYHSPLVPGLHSSADAERLAEELAFAARRLLALSVDPPGLYREVADSALDIEEGTWIAFLIAYLCPLDEPDPFSSIRETRTSWASGADPELEIAQTGPRAAHDPAGGSRTLEAYRAWSSRAGSQSAAITGEASWTPQRRFARVFERLALPGFHRDARFDFLVTLGRLRVYELEAGSLQLGGANEPTLAAKRIFGIGDQLLLERRAAELAEAAALPLEAFDAGLYNWGRGERATLGLGQDTEPDPEALRSVREALGL